MNERKEKMNVKKFSENDIQKKLYGDTGFKKKTIAKEKEDMHENNEAYLDKDIQEEIDALKTAITNLEQTLKKTEGQKERLKKKLVQRRFVINLKDRVLNNIISKVPEKVIILIPVLVIILLMIIVFNLHNETAPVTTTDVTVVEEVINVPQKKIAVASAKEPDSEKVGIGEKKYTLQVAEYSNEQAAVKFVGDLEQQGFTVALKTIYRGDDKSRPYFKVNVGVFGSFNEAKKFMEAFERKTGIKDSFIKQEIN
ncbi:MAG: SPOR domain-containing protein [Candidatus Omnitrophota bacterium]